MLRPIVCDKASQTAVESSLELCALEVFSVHLGCMYTSDVSLFFYVSRLAVSDAKEQQGGFERTSQLSHALSSKSLKCRCWLLHNQLCSMFNSILIHVSFMHIVIIIIIIIISLFKSCTIQSTG